MWLMLACAPAVRDFAEARAAAVCRWHERCATLDVAGFESFDACLGAYEDAVGHAAAAQELECESFDEAAADACLATWSSIPCGTTVDLSACDEVCAG